MSASSSPWKVPDNWAWIPIGEVAGVVGGATPRTIEASNFDGGTVPWVTPADLSGYAERYIGCGSRNITTVGLHNSGARLLPEGTVLFSSRAPIGYVAIASNPLATNQGFKSFVLPPGLAPEYVYYFLQRAKELAVGLASGTTFQEISGRQAAKIPLTVAPSGEQHRIVSALESHFSRLDDAVATLERVQRNLTRYRASVLKAAVEGRLVPTEAEVARAEGRSYEPAAVLLERILAERRQRWEEAELAKMKAKGKTLKGDKWKGKYVEPVTPDTSELPELPEGWCWASCAQLLQRLQTGPFGSSLHKSDYVTGGTPVINPEHLRNYGIHPSEQVGVSSDTVARLSAFLLNAGDIVLGRRGEMGRCALVGSREGGWLLGTGSLALRPFRGVVGDFLAWVLRSPRSVRILEGESVGTTMTNLNQEILFNLPIPLAPATEQSRIAREIERLFSVIDALDLAGATQRLHCTRLRQAILKWAFEGRLVDQDSTDEPASVLLERIRAERAVANNAPLEASRDGRTRARPRRKARTKKS